MRKSQKTAIQKGDEMNIAELAQQLQLTDVGKLLLMFDSAKRGDEDMSEREVDAIAYLLTAKKVLPFGYSFLLSPLPFSTRLHEDLYGLIRTGYIDKRNPVYITQKGSDWVSAVLSQYDYSRDNLIDLIQTVKELLTEYRRQAFDLIYAAMTQ